MSSHTEWPPFALVKKAAAQRTEASGPTGTHRMLKLTLSNCTPRTSRLVKSICGLLCRMNRTEYDDLLRARAAMIVNPDGEVELTYDVEGGDRAN